MNISDIPKFANITNNSESVPLSNLKLRLDLWDKDYGLDLNPLFQRGHVWKLEYKIKFVEFILKGGKAPMIMFNSPAYGNKSSNLSDIILLVDGKQRISALLEFLDNKIPVFNGFYRKDIVGIEMLLKRRFITVCVNLLTTHKEILEWYVEINEGNVAHSEEELLRVKKLLSEELA